MASLTEINRQEFIKNAGRAFDVLNNIIQKGQTVTDYTLEHVLYSHLCNHGDGFTYDFCPIAGDPVFLQEYNHPLDNFDGSKSRYVKGQQ